MNNEVYVQYMHLYAQWSVKVYVNVYNGMYSDIQRYTLNEQWYI